MSMSKHGYSSDGMREVCEDYTPHDCEHCEFSFIKAPPYCPEVRGVPCPGFSISFSAFSEALDRWEKDNPGREP